MQIMLDSASPTPSMSRSRSPSSSSSRPLPAVRGLAEVMAAARVGAWRLNLTSGQLQASATCKANFGLPPDADFTFEQFQASLHPDDRDQVQRRIENAIAESIPYAAEYGVFWPDGSLHFIHSQGQATVRDGDGAVVELIGVCLDITDRRLGEYELHAARQRDAFRLAFTDALRPLSAPREIKRVAAQMVGEYLQASRALYAEMLEDGDTVIVEADHCRDGLSSLAGVHSQADYGHVIAERLLHESSVAIDDTAHYEAFSPSDRAAMLAVDAAAFLCVPLVKDGRWVACLILHQATPRAWTPDEIALMEEVAERTWASVERAKAEIRLRESERRLEADLRDTMLLHAVSAELIHHEDAQALYARLVDAAMLLMDSQYASLQILCRERGEGGELKLLAYRGFNDEAVRFWQWVAADSHSVCAEALRSGDHVVVIDVEQSQTLADTDELRMLRRNGIRAVQSTPLRARDGHIVGMLSTHWAEPHAPSERELRLLGILAREAADLLERHQSEESLREASVRKDEFLATLAHELRNPLAPITNGLHLLKRMLGQSPDVAAQLEMMRRQVGNLGRLVDDLLELSRISRGTIELRKSAVTLADVVLSAVETSRPLVDQARHSLDIQLPSQPLLVHADAFRLGQALSNLINNAAKYTPKGGRISVILTAHGDSARLCVRDNGIGLPPELQTRVFDMFTQGEHTRERQQGGLGIGLTLVRSLVELHGGQVSAHSDGLGHGSEFVIQLPLLQGCSEPVTTRAAVPRRSHDHAHRQNVLVVDDNHEAADTLALLLRLAERDVRVGYDGAACLEAVAQERPDVILLDLGLPMIDGFEACRRIRHMPGGENIAIIAVSGWGRERDRERTREAGFDLHLTKPVDPDTLLHQLDELELHPLHRAPVGQAASLHSPAPPRPH